MRKAGPRSVLNAGSPKQRFLRHLHRRPSVSLLRGVPSLWHERLRGSRFTFQPLQAGVKRFEKLLTWVR